jgi:multiple sugar transport system permease protein
MSIYPILWNFRKSFESRNGSFPSLYQFKKLFGASDFYHVLINTFVWVIVSLMLCLVIGLALAILFNQNYRGRNLIRTISILPWAIPAIAASSVWKWMFNADYGILDHILMSLKITREHFLWLVDIRKALGSLILVNIWRTVPFVMLTCLSGLQTIPVEIYEACSLDGIGPFRRLFKITIPLLFPVIRATILLLTIWIFNSFIYIYNITKGGPAKASETLAVFVHRVGIKEYNYPYSAAASVVLFFLTLIITVFYVIASNKNGEDIAK